jgi:hypothetical protein
MLKFFYYDRDLKKNFIFRSKDRETAIKRVRVLTRTKLPDWVIDDKLKSDLQLACVASFNIPVKEPEPYASAKDAEESDPQNKGVPTLNESITQ